MTMQHAHPRSERYSALRVLERLLFGTGLICVVLYASACAERSFFQSFIGRGFDRELERVLGDEVHDQRDWSIARVSRFQASQGSEVEALGRLEIPSVGISVMLLEGTDDDTLDRAVGRIEGTARLGESGNLGIAGHRDSFFRGLRHIEKGNLLSLATRDGLARYEVTEISIVQPRDVEVLDPTDEPSITLVTCYPFYFVGKAPERYVVRARQLDSLPWSREQLDRYAAKPSTLARRD
jgi:LPXTG-site transpeptidase (sortase) family protein